MRLPRIFALLAMLGFGPAAGALPPLPEPVTNNVVAVARAAGRDHVVSLLGLGPGKTWRDLQAGGYIHVSGSEGWEALPSVPDGQGRLAAAVATVTDRILIFGGYTVAQDGSESSTPYVYALDVASRRYDRLADIPTPVDDSVALVYQDRYVYLISGWHDKDNVALVQLYDAVENRWRQATVFPGTPVFGHAGGIAGRRMLVCDGVQVVRQSGPGRYAPSDECWLGEIDKRAPERIDWTRNSAHPGVPRYRMAAIAEGDGILFVGGSANPYNYDGIGYDGQPAEPEATALRYDFERQHWRMTDGVAAMDLRSLAVTDGRAHIVGGMRAGQSVSASVLPVPRENQQ